MLTILSPARLQDVSVATPIDLNRSGEIRLIPPRRRRRESFEGQHRQEKRGKPHDSLPARLLDHCDGLDIVVLGIVELGIERHAELSVDICWFLPFQSSSAGFNASQP
jgi:hypothetical protein